MHIGSNLKYLRKKYNLSQKDFTKVVGVNPPTISLWETDTVTPPLSKLNLISKYFNVSIDLLINGNMELITQNLFYDVNDFGFESRLLFGEISKDSRDKLLRTMYEFVIKDNSKNRLPTSFSQRQMIATLSESSDIILREFAHYLKRFLDQYEKLHVAETKELLLDIIDYLAKGKESSNEFLTLKRNVMELLFPLVNFQFANNQENYTTAAMSKQFHLDPSFVLLVLKYYIQVKGTIFFYQDLQIDLQKIEFTHSNENVYDKEISITNIK